MIKAPVTAIYRCPSYVEWAVKSSGIILVNKRSKQTIHLHYPEAVVWDLMSRKNDIGRIIHMLGIICSLKTRVSKRLVCKSLEEWADAGFLKKIHHA